FSGSLSFSFIDPPPTALYTLSLHDALPISVQGYRYNARVLARHLAETRFGVRIPRPQLQPAETVRFLLNELSHGPELWHQRSYRSEEHTSELQSRFDLVCRLLLEKKKTTTK